MFEQSLLIEHGAAKRSGALAASFSAQAVGLGVLILAPLIYRTPLPLIQPLTIPSPLPMLPRAPEPAEHHVTPQIRHVALAQAPVFRLPGKLRPIAAILSDPPDAVEAPDIGNALPGEPNGVVGAPADAYGLPHFAPPPPIVKAAPIPKPPLERLMVGGDVQSAKLIRRVVPQYPVLARQARISGTVRLVGVIAKDGSIQQLHVESGHPLLIPAALAAVRQWIYRPTLLNGTPVEVIAPIDVIFTLNQ